MKRYISSHITCICLTIIFAAVGCARRADVVQQIVFASKAFGDSAQTGPGDGSVYITGTLSGVGVPYKNNTVAVTCYKDRMECLTYSVAQIGPNQVGSLDMPMIYPVSKWDPYEIVATGSADLVNCRKVTISIVRKAQIVVWVEEPINQSSSACVSAETRVFKWTIEDPPWKAALQKTTN